MDEPKREVDSQAPGSTASEGEARRPVEGRQQFVVARSGSSVSFQVAGDKKAGGTGKSVQKRKSRPLPPLKEQPTTFRQRKFVKRYLENGGNIADSYMATLTANSRKGLKSKEASSKGRSMLNSAGVQYLLDSAQNRKDVAIAPVLAKYAVTQERIVEEFAKIAFADPRDIMSWNDEGVVVKDSNKIGEAAGAVSEIQASSGKNGKSVKVKQYDKVAALTALAKIMGLNQEKPPGPSLAVQFVIQGKED